MLRLPAFLCWAFRQIQTAPSGAPLLCLMAHPCCAFRRLPALRSGEGGGGAGRRDVRSGFGSRGVVGSRAGKRLRRGRGVGGAHGGRVGAGPRHGDGFRIFR